MSGVISEAASLIAEVHLKDFAALCLTGLCVKIIDDILDEEGDRGEKCSTLSTVLGRGASSYAVVLLAASTLISPGYSAPYVFGSYVIGMLSDTRARLPSGLRAYQESLLVLLAGVLLAGLAAMAAVTTALLSLQVMDDWLDRRFDQRTGQRNLFLALGEVEASLVGVISALISLLFSPIHLIYLAACYPLITLVERQCSRTGREGTHVVDVD